MPRTSGRVTTLRIDFVNWTGPAVAVRVFTTNGHKGGATVHIRRAVFKRNHFHS
ncbi:hypothetical protein ACWDAO_28715 [Streptomyces sp. NPDC001212]